MPSSRLKIARYTFVILSLLMLFGISLFSRLLPTVDADKQAQASSRQA